MTEALHVKYRPTTFDEVVGQGPIVASLKKIVERRGAHAFLLGGPSGCGKTTLARIVARALGCIDKDIAEIDAATHTGVDAMRALQEPLRYKPFGKSQSRAMIVDEAHGLSKQAWDSLLKIVEEPPEHVFWFFCTTNASKVPTTIKTRCAPYILKPVAEKDLTALLDYVADEEKMKISDAVAQLVVKEAHGSPRQMLVNLAICQDVTDKKKAAELLRSAVESDPVIELAKFLMQGGSWPKAMGLVAKIEGTNPESARIVITNYFSAVARNAQSDRAACGALAVLDAFSQPYQTTDNTAPLLVSIGRVLFGNNG